MHEARGTIILCDQLYPSINGKWIIAGTYTTWNVRPGELHLDLPTLNVYIRFQVEKAGDCACELLLVHRALPSNAPAIIRQDFTVRINDPLSPCEMGCVMPSFRVRCPEQPTQPTSPLIGVPLLLWLKVAGEDIATCPLNIIFRPQRGPIHADDPAKRPDAGNGP